MTGDLQVVCLLVYLSNNYLDVCLSGRPQLTPIAIIIISFKSP